MKQPLIASVLAALLALAGFGSHAAEPIAAQAEQVFRSGFRADNPKYWMTRLDQDEAMRLCSQHKDSPPPKVRAHRSGDRHALHIPFQRIAQHHGKDCRFFWAPVPGVLLECARQ